MSYEVRGDKASIRYRDANGKLVRETLGPKSQWSRAKAMRAEASRRAQVAKGYAHPTKITFEALSNEWFNDTAQRRRWAPRTEKAYTTSLARLSVFKTKPAHQIKRSDVERFIADSLKTYAAKTVNFDISTLNAVLEFGVRLELYSINVAHRAPRPKNAKRKWRILTPEEVRLVDAAFEDEDARLIFRVLTRTGLRRHEIRNLRVEDLDLVRGALCVRSSKTEEGERWISLPSGLTEQLRAYTASRRGFVFKSSRGNQFGGQWYTDLFNKALKTAGVTDYVRPFHDMRHTSLTNEAATGASNPLALMAKAGHRNMATTRQYMHLAGVLFPEQAEALDRLYEGKPNV